MSDAIPTEVLSVTQLTTEIKRRLQSLANFWVGGEISNWSASGAGHCYLTLKDDSSQLRAVLWNADRRRLAFEPHDGLEVMAFGSLDVYGPRGQYQLVIRQLLPKGIGPLELAFRQLRDKLAAEGLFDRERKRPIPRFPKRIAVISSPTGAAIRDFLEVASRRWCSTLIDVIPATVQGDRSVGDILLAIEKAQRLDVDVIALVRGGGSLEDLWSFNDERIARAIVASSIPVVTGVGHEIDVTIADLVADLRALTPSEAAERIFPDSRALAQDVANLSDRLQKGLLSLVQRRREAVERAANSRALQRPVEMLADRQRLTDDLERRILRAIELQHQNSDRQLRLFAEKLESLSPLGVLRRGYSLTTKGTEERLVRCIRDFDCGEELHIRFIDGKAAVRVEEIEELK